MFYGTVALQELTTQWARDPCKESQHVAGGVVSYAQDLLLGFLEVSVGIRDQYPSSPMTHLLYGKGSPSMVLGPATSASPTLLAMQILRPHPALLIRTNNLLLPSHPGDAAAGAV